MAPTPPLAEEAAASRSSQTWAMLIKRALSTNNLARSIPYLVRSVVADESGGIY
jgi:hypothetical protein